MNYRKVEFVKFFVIKKVLYVFYLRNIEKVIFSGIEDKKCYFFEVFMENLYLYKFY